MASIIWYFLSISSLTRASPISPLQNQIFAANGSREILGRELAPAWAEDPNVRGTMDLLWTCIITLSICVYTVIHLNIPPPGESAKHFFWRKTKWVIITILAPEFGLAVAFYQWDTARKLREGLNLTVKMEDMPTRRFGKTYCYYAAMGGFVVDVSHIHDTLGYVTVQPEGLLYLASKQLYLDIDEDAIKDRSKADWLAKILTCGQVTWMATQCIGRKIHGYPISLLEIHVMAHVLCALVMYVLWWNKPLDIFKSKIVEESEFQQELAFMLFMSKCSKDERKLRYVAPKDRSDLGSAELEATAQVISSTNGYDINDAEDAPLVEAQDSQDGLGKVTQQNMQKLLRKAEVDSAALYNQFNPIAAPKILSIKAGEILDSGIGPYPRDKEGNDVDLTEKEVERWNLAATIMSENNYTSGNLSERCNFLGGHSTNLQGSLSLYKHKAHHRKLVSSPLFYVLVLVLPIVYGSLHLTAWNSSFPTKTEQYLWRTSSLIIAVGIPAVTALMIFGVAILTMMCLREESSSNKFMKRLWSITLYTEIAGGITLAMLVPLFYIAARLFLLVEAFISIRALPIGTYITVSWSDYIPHI